MLHVLIEAVGYVVPFVLVLSLVVTVHELGHFLVARALGVAVDRFSIGFGRAILSWRDHWGVEWRLGWIPLGGYVRFAGDAEASSSVPDAARLQDMRQRINATEGAGAEHRYFHFKPVWERALVVAAGPAANFILAVVIFAALLMALGSTVLAPRVGQVQAGSAAARAGFMKGDLVTALDGRLIDDYNDIPQYVQLRAGEPIRFDVRRTGADGRVAALALTATPQLTLIKQPITGRPTRVGVLGIYNSGLRSDVMHRSYTPVTAVAEGVRRTADIVQTTVFYLGRIVQGKDSGSQLGGPLGMAQASHQLTKAASHAEAAWPDKVAGVAVALLSLAAVLSVGIGFMNLMPIPVLDGGHLVFYAYEALARRPVAAKVQAAGYRVGLALLLGLMLFATWNDVQQLIPFKLLGGLFS